MRASRRRRTMFLYGVVNASPDSLNTDSIVAHRRASPRPRPAAAGRRRRRPRPGRPGQHRRGRGGAVGGRVGAPARAGAGTGRAGRADERGHVAPGGAAPRAAGRRHRDQRRRRHAERRDVAGGRRVRRADRGAVPQRARTRGRWRWCDRDPVEAIIEFFDARLRDADRYGLRSRCVLDPGTGFAPRTGRGTSATSTRSGCTATSTRCACSGCRCTSRCRGRRPPSTTSCSRSWCATQPEFGRVHYPAKVRSFERRIASG